MTTPTRTQTLEALRRITLAAERLEASVRWAEAVGERGWSERRRGVPQRDVRRRDEGERQNEEGVPAPQYGDPSGEAATDALAAYVRGLHRDACRWIVRAMTYLEGAQRSYERAEQKMLDADNSALDEMSVTELIRSGHRVNQAELRSAQKAQGRRYARNEGWGTG